MLTYMYVLQKDSYKTTAFVERSMPLKNEMKVKPMIKWGKGPTNFLYLDVRKCFKCLLNVDLQP